LRQHYQLLALEFFVKKKKFEKEETKNGDCCQCRIKAFFKKIVCFEVILSVIQ
jgi:hypothetical protein